MTEHAPTRPEWTCEPCAQPWPCDTARVELGERYASNRVYLSVYMAGQLAHAAREVPHVPPQELHERFVAWTR